MKQFKKSSLETYCHIYDRIYAAYLQQAAQFGLPLGSDEADKLTRLRRTLREMGALFENNDHSLSYGWISPACKACRQGRGSYTFFLSLQCHRQCYYCFNGNQEDYDLYRKERRDYRRELFELADSGQNVSYLALTGGEPLLLPAETVNFFQLARRLFPKVHTRLYTSADLLNESLLKELQKVGLQELRASIKLEDGAMVIEQVLHKLEDVKRFIPDVVVEMPVIPGNLTAMKELLERLAAIGIKGINLLEFCFPFVNHSEFAKRRFVIKNPPCQIPYDYWYAGGLPVAESEDESLQLLIYAMENKLSLGVHVCTLENKHTGQIFQQNVVRSGDDFYYFSPRDYFLKTVKVFGSDKEKVESCFQQSCYENYICNQQYDYVEFPVQAVALLQKKQIIVDLLIASFVVEWRADIFCMREVGVQRISIGEFFACSCCL